MRTVSLISKASLYLRRCSAHARVLRQNLSAAGEGTGTGVLTPGPRQPRATPTPPWHLLTSLLQLHHLLLVGLRAEVLRQPRRAHVLLDLCHDLLQPLAEGVLGAERGSGPGGAGGIAPGVQPGGLGLGVVCVAGPGWLRDPLPWFADSFNQPELGGGGDSRSPPRHPRRSPPSSAGPGGNTRSSTCRPHPCSLLAQVVLLPGLGHLTLQVLHVLLRRRDHLGVQVSTNLKGESPKTQP